MLHCTVASRQDQHKSEPLLAVPELDVDGVIVCLAALLRFNKRSHGEAIVFVNRDAPAWNSMVAPPPPPPPPAVAGAGAGTGVEVKRL